MAKKNNNTAVGIGIGAAAVAVMALGAYFMYGEEGVKNRKKAKGWMLKAKGEILEHLEKMENVTKDNYTKVVDKVATKYAEMKPVEQKELALFVKEMKGHWRAIKKAVAPKTKK